MQTIPMTATRTALVTIIISLLYAVIRYHIIGDVPWSQFPIFMVNKATACSGVILLGLAGLNNSVEKRHRLGLFASACLGLHCLLSLMLLSPSNFAGKFFQATDHTFTAIGGFALLCGALGLLGQAVLWRRSMNTAPNSSPSLINGLGRILLLLAAAHVSLIGFRTWPQWSQWPGYLPPITLIIFIIAIGLAFANHRKKRSTPSQGH
jgi:DMSO/TMAO reductase YedYZ heme-binding membrane subunit